MMEAISRKLIILKKDIDEAKIHLAKLDGREQEVLLGMKKTHNLSSTEEAEKEIKKLEKEESKLAEIIKTEYDALREIAEW
jgi:3-dehydroquinate synthase class II